MKFILLVMLRVVWGYLAIRAGWNLLLGNFVHPFHPVNLAQTIALIIGVLTIWMPSRGMKLVASVSGIGCSSLMYFQMLMLMTMFSFYGEVQTTFVAQVGPFSVEGALAVVVVFLVPLLLFILSMALLLVESEYFVKR